MKTDYLEIEKALVEGRITPQQFISILIDNFGFANTAEILKQNLDLVKE